MTWTQRIAQAVLKVAAELVGAPSGRAAKGQPEPVRERLKQPKGRVQPPKDAA